MSRPPCIVAMGGGGFSQEPDNPLLDDWVLGLTGVERPRVCFLPTASGDSDHYVAEFHAAFGPERCRATHLGLFRRRVDDLRSVILAQDLVYVGGGNTLNMMEVWRVHGLGEILREARDEGVVMAGVSAGGLCWFESGVTDSRGTVLTAIDGLLGWLPGSFCPHWDGEEDRRPAYRRMVETGALPPGLAADDGVALRFAGRELVEVVSSRPRARALRVEPGEDGVRETVLETRYLGAERS